MKAKTTEYLIPLHVTDLRESRNKDRKGKKEKFQTITFWDPDNRMEVKTDLVTTYGNYQNWKKVIKYMSSNNDTQILKGNFNYKDLDIINADSKFAVAEFGVSWNDVAEIIDAN